MKQQKRKMQVSLSILLAAVMLIGMCAVLPVTAAGAKTSGDYEYENINDGTVRITGYTGTDDIITIPSEIDGKKVSRIGIGAFWGCTSLTSVKIPETVTGLEVSAFSGCTSLAGIDIPNSVTSIEMNAFGNCTSLTSIKIPESVVSIGSEAFRDCRKLTGIKIPKKVTKIASAAFVSCVSLTDVEIPQGVTSIGGSAFYDCSNLTKVTIPRSVETIGYHAFGYKNMIPNDGFQYGKIDNFTICGYKGTPAQAYANDNGFLFIAEVVLGDADLDGEIKVADVLLMQKVIAKIIQPSEEQIEAGDIDHDGTITVKDVLSVQKYLAKVIPNL